MNNNNNAPKKGGWTMGKKILAIVLGLFIVIGLIVTVYLVRKQQETRSHAEKATVLSLDPATQSAPAGGDAVFDVKLDPGVNQVNFVKFVIQYDPNEFTLDENSFVLNESSNLRVVSTPVVGDGTLTVTLSAGADPTKVIQTPTALGKVDFQVNSDAENGDHGVGFQKDNSVVRSIGSNDSFNENVLQSVAGATITVGAGICKPNVSTCSWDKSENATSYHYKIISLGTPKESSTSQDVAEGDTSSTSVEFDSTPGVTYQCTVTANNECGTSDSASGQAKCPVPSVTPTPGVSETPTPTVGLTETPTPTTVIETPTPTTPLEIVTATPVITTVIAQGTTPVPTLPATGNPVVTGGIIGGLLFLIGGLALLFL